MTVGDAELGRRFGPYVIGVFDILGQQRSLYQLPGARSPGAPRDVQVLEYLSDTVGRVLRIRNLFASKLQDAAPTVKRMAQILGAPTLQEQIPEPSLRHWGMSDSYVVAIPPPDGQEFSTVSTLIDVYRMLEASAEVWLLAMRDDLPIRGGIEMGIAIDVGEREVYGHALAEALRLESKVAQYPRIAVGEKLIFLLNDAVDFAAERSGEEAGLAEILGGLCWRLLDKDEDGQLVVNVASGSVAGRMREHRSDVLAAVMRNVEAQLKRHECAGDSELVRRYQWLQRRLAQPS